MNEVNINIEGYNVNGICVGCLNYNRRMFYDEDAKEVFRIVGNIDVPDGLSIQVCWECLAAVKSVVRFKKQIQDAFDVLITYSRQHTFLNSPEDFTRLSSTRLSTSRIQHVVDITWIDVDILNVDQKDVVVKDESIFINDDTQSSMKQEPTFDYSDHHNTYHSGTQLENDSDEDIQLSKLREKKSREKREKKKGKKKKKKPKKDSEPISEPSHICRKLKNLPSSIVTLHTLTEQEMWVVRNNDVNSNEFKKLKHRCNDCIIGFNSEKLMNDHMNGKHKPKSESALQCDVCKAYFLTKDNLSLHRSLHLSSYKCVQCGHTTTLKRNMCEHDCVKGAMMMNEEYTCQDCDKVFSSKSKLSYHKNVVHTERPQCDCCGKVFANKMTLKYHLKILPQNKDEKPKEKLYITCKGCNKVFHTKKSYRAHVVIHDGITYPCPICGKQFQWKRNLTRHTRAHKDRAAGAAHECRQCRKRFASRDCLKNHLRFSKKHADRYSFSHECNYCGKKFATKWCMVDHIDWDHLKRVKYQCSVCFKAFKTAKIMVAHMNNIHEGKKKDDSNEGEHLCDICGKSYKTEKRLKGHVWAMHTQRTLNNSKSYKCKLCPATFSWQTSVYKHMKMMHDNNRTKPPRVNVATSNIASVKKQEHFPQVDISYFHMPIATQQGQIVV